MKVCSPINDIFGQKINCNKIRDCLQIYDFPVNSFSFIYFLDLLHRVRRRPQRRKRNTTGPTLHLMKRRGARKKSWKATRRKAKRTKRIMGRIARRNRRRGNMKPLPLLPAPVNPQIVTEKTEWFRTWRVNIHILQVMKTCRHYANEAPHSPVKTPFSRTGI